MTADSEFIPVEQLPYAKELVTKLPYAESELRETVTQAIGAASACWENLSGAGIFESEKALKVRDDLIEEILRLTGMGEPNLGCASNEELWNELEIRRTMGYGIDVDPQYRSID